MSSALDEAASQRPQNPLERFAGGGWRKGLLRLLLAAVLLAVVMWLAGDRAWTALKRPGVVKVIVAGSVVHGLQRAARIRKWWHMIAGSALAQHGYAYLLRIQLMGMLANLALPVSEALKVWAVAHDKRTALLATESLLVDLGIHSAALGGLALAACVVCSFRSPVPAAAWAAAAALTLIPVLLILALRARRKQLSFSVLSWPIAAWTLVETCCQLGIYALALSTVAPSLPQLRALALAPLLYLSDLVMLTPAGLGLREALFAGVFEGLSSTPVDLAVAAALMISAMLFVTAAVGGGIAMLLPGGERATLG